jgi:hypothetical protein
MDENGVIRATTRIGLVRSDVAVMGGGNTRYTNAEIAVDYGYDTNISLRLSEEIIS